MTPERIAELRAEYAGKCSPHRHHCKRGDWAWMTLDVLELLDALESAQKEIADLKRGGVVVPEWNANAFALACVASGTYADGDLRAAIRNAEVGYNFAISRLRTIPADRVLGEGEVAVDRGWRDLVGQLHMTAIDFVNEADPGMLRAAAPMVRAVAALRSRSNALRAQLTQEPAP